MAPEPDMFIRSGSKHFGDNIETTIEFITAQLLALAERIGDECRQPVGIQVPESRMKKETCRCSQSIPIPKEVKR